MKIRMSYHWTSTRIAIVKKKLKKLSIGKNVEILEPLYIADRKVRWYSHVENSLVAPQKLKQSYHMP